MKKRVGIGIVMVILFLGVLGDVVYLRNKNNQGKVEGAKTTQSEVRGIVLPHHNLATELFNDSYAKLAKTLSPKLIVILGTNHYLENSPTVITTNTFPDASLDQDIANRFITKFPDVLVNETAITNDHSIMVQIPYIHQYFPNAKVFPMIISAQFTEGSLTQKAQFLSTLPQDTLFIASVDFAHNVGLTEGLSKNKESIQTISQFDYKTLYTYYDDHLDSPIAISLFLHVMSEIGANSWNTWFSSHSAILKNDPSIQGTSYVVGTFQ